MALRDLTSADADAVFPFVLIHAFPREQREPDAAIEMPEVRRWLDHWDMELGVGWHEGGPLLGAAWARHLEPILALDPLSADPLPELILAVVPAARGRGIGQNLIEGLKQRAIAAREPGLAIVVNDRYPIAIRLYEQAGFNHQLHTENGANTLVWLASSASSG
jgi:GNAT superfamily N-acetyltransferase